MNDQQKKLYAILMVDYATKRRLTLPEALNALLSDVRDMAIAQSIPYDKKILGEKDA